MTPSQAITELREHFERICWTSYGSELGARGMACVLALEQELTRLRQLCENSARDKLTSENHE